MFKDFKQGPRTKFRKQLFWAEGGLLCIEDQDTGNFKALTRMEAAARAISLNAELKFIEYPSERDELCKCVVALCAAIKEAKNQGDPTDPEVRKQLVKDKRKISVLMDTSTSSASILAKEVPMPKALPQQFKGAAILGGSDRFNKLRI